MDYPYENFLNDCADPIEYSEVKLFETIESKTDGIRNSWRKRKPQH